MNSIITKIVLLSFLVFLFLPKISHAAPARRIALVIGNSNYTDGRLKNPVNDATDMAAALKSLGFTVTLRKDADLREMKDEIDNFGNSLKKGDVGLFFYAGHGIQVGGINYLIPVRAKISNANMVEHEALDVNRLLSILDNAGNSVNIVMLDACRDNPIARSSRGAGRGLAFITRQPPGTIISYSTGANQVADDGDERNSPYTAALLRHIKTPGLPIEQVFKRVRNRVVEQTRGKQEPAEYTMLRKDFYFVPESASKSVAIAPKGEAASVSIGITPLPLREIAIIIDDIGNDLEPVKQLLEIDTQITFSILPFSGNTRAAAEMLHAAQREILLHLPMEPNNYPREKPGNGALFTDMNDHDLLLQLDKDLAAVPHISGVGNHMGSKFMNDEEKLTLVFDMLRKKNLFFIDGRTAASSKALTVSEKTGVPLAVRRIFIDNDRDYNEIYKILVEIAQNKNVGDASPFIVIGHPHPETIRAIKDATKILQAHGINIVPVSKLIKDKML